MEARLRGRLDYAEQAHLIDPFVVGERTSRRSIDGRFDCSTWAGMTSKLLENDQRRWRWKKKIQSLVRAVAIALDHADGVRGAR